MSNYAKRVWTTLVTNEGYLPAALVLDYSLKSVNSKYPLVIMVTPTLSEEARGIFRRRGIAMREVESLVVKGTSYAFKRFSDVWTKLRGFELFEYDRVVLVDSDMLVRRNMDELLEMDLDADGDTIAAAHACACNPAKFPHYPADWIPANCAYTSPQQPAPFTEGCPRPYGLLNSGTVVLTPSPKSAQAIKQFISESPLVAGYQFPDQDLLADVFRGRWKALPWYYNALKPLRIIHSNVWKDEDVRCLHYILAKPWTTRPGQGGDHEEVNQLWWDAFYALGAELSCEEATRSDWLLVERHVAPA